MAGGGGHVWQRGVRGRWGVHGRGCVCGREACVAGGHAWWGACMAGGRCMHGRGVHGNWMHGRGCAWPPTVDTMTDACKNITLPQTSFTFGKNEKSVPFCNDLMLQIILRPQIVLATRH